MRRPTWWGPDACGFWLARILVYLVTFAIHAVVTAAIVVATRHIHRATSEAGMFMRLSSLLTVTMFALVFAHVIEIVVWAGYFSAVGLQVKNADLFEFAFENYTALGYGDALPPEQYRAHRPDHVAQRAFADRLVGGHHFRGHADGRAAIRPPKSLTGSRRHRSNC